jgi:4-aminobutyrate aminotransferase
MMNQEIPQSEGDSNRTNLRQHWHAECLSDETRNLLAEDEAHFIRQSLSTPCLNVLSRCDGAWIEDVEGRRYLDFHGNNVHQVGFGHPRVVKAITEQMQELSFCTRRYTNRPAIFLAAKLAAVAPGNLNKVLLAPAGTVAIGMALKLARAATGRFKTISLWDSFHGASLDAISIGGEATFRNGAGPLLPGTEHAPPPDPVHCPFRCGVQCNLRCADYIAYILEKEGDVAAVIAETVRSTPYVPPVDYWKTVRAACDKNGALLILDEIPHALGRTGRMFTFEHYGIVPDMVVIGKGLGGGIFPLAALIAREELDIAPERGLGHYTHEKNPVACAAALAAIEVIEDGLLAHVEEVGQYTLDALHGLEDKHPLVHDVRGLGLLMGMALRDIHGMTAVEAAERIMYGALRKGMNFKVTMGTILTLTPALIITKQEMDRAIHILDEEIYAVEAIAASRS